MLDLAEAAADKVLVHPDLGTNMSPPGSSTRQRRAPAATSRQAAEDSAIVIERTYRQQRLIPAFMEPRSVVADPTGEQTVVYSATQIPHILKLMLALTCGISGVQAPGRSPPTSVVVSAASCR